MPPSSLGSHASIRQSAPAAGAPCRSPRHYCAGERRPFDCGLIRHEQEPRSQHYPSSVAASHPIDGMVALCPSTVTPRGRQVAPGIVPDWSAGIHRNIARKKPRASVAHGAHAPARIERNGTNPIVRSRVSRSVESGFNEVTHSVRPDPQRRATSQKPPDSQGLVFLIRWSKREEACDGGSDWGSIGLHFGGFATFCAAMSRCGSGSTRVGPGGDSGRREPERGGQYGRRDFADRARLGVEVQRERP